MPSVNSTTLYIAIILLNSIAFGQFATQYHGSDFVCDSDSKICPKDSIFCDANQDCNIQCIDAPDRRRRRLSSSEEETQCNSNNPGCCQTNIYCPMNAECNIDCSYSCNNITVNASLSTQLTITNCGANCNDMQITCPYTTDTDATCIITGDSDIESLNIYAKHGFDDISIDLSDHLLIDSIVHCANTNLNSFCSIDPITPNACHLHSLSLPCSSNDNTTSTATPSTTATPTTTVSSVESVESAESASAENLESFESSELVTSFNITADGKVAIDHKEKSDSGKGIVYVQINDNNATFFLVILVAAVLFCGLTAVFCVYCSIFTKKRFILHRKKKQKPHKHNVFEIGIRPGTPLPESIIASTPRARPEYVNDGLMLNLAHIDQKVAMAELKKKRMQIEANNDSQDSNDDMNMDSVEITLDVDEFVIEAKRTTPMHPISTGEMGSKDGEIDTFYMTGITAEGDDDDFDDISL